VAFERILKRGVTVILIARFSAAFAGRLWPEGASGAVFERYLGLVLLVEDKGLLGGFLREFQTVWIWDVSGNNIGSSIFVGR